MLDILKFSAVAFFIFLIIDAVWLGLIAKNMYKNKIGHLMANKPNWVAAVVFYLFYIVGLTFFVIQPAISMQSISHAILAGLFFGAITYATYDLTNMATLRDWPLSLTIIDIVWGSALCSLVSLFTYLIFI